MAAHAWWRVRIKTVNTGNYCSAAKVEFRATVGGADQCSGGTPKSSYDAGGADDNAFDANLNTFWSTYTWVAPQWIGYQFASPVSVAEIAYTSRNDGYGANEAPKNFNVESSDDGILWLTESEHTNVTGWSQGQTRTFELTFPAPSYYNTDFSEYALNEQPADWSKSWTSTPASDWDVISATNPISGDRVLKKLSGGNPVSTGMDHLVWDDLGSVEDIELLACIRNVAGTDKQAALVLRVQSGGTDVEAGLVSGTTIRVGKLASYVWTQWATDTLAYSVNEWCWVRVRIMGNVLLVRAWHDGDEEPASWDINNGSASGAQLNAGRAGLFCYATSLLECAYLSAATLGGIAPSPGDLIPTAPVIEADGGHLLNTITQTSGGEGADTIALYGADAGGDLPADEPGEAADLLDADWDGTALDETGLSHSQKRYYRAYATNDYGTTASNLVDATTDALAPPTAPVIEAAGGHLKNTITKTGGGAGATTITLYGAAASGDVPVGGPQGAAYQLSANWNGAALDDTGLAHSTKRYYRAYATNTDGTTPSNLVDATTDALAPPTAPVIEAVEGGELGELDVTQTGGGVGAVTVALYGADASGDLPAGGPGAGADLLDADWDGATVTETGLGYGVTRYYRAYATNPDGMTPSNLDSATTADPRPGTPVITGAVTAAQQITITVGTPGSAATEHELYAQEDTATGLFAAGNLAVDDLGATPDPIVIDGVEVGSTWYFGLRAKNVYGDTDSLAISVVVPEAQLEANLITYHSATLHLYGATYATDVQYQTTLRADTDYSDAFDDVTLTSSSRFERPLSDLDPATEFRSRERHRIDEGAWSDWLEVEWETVAAPPDTSTITYPIYGEPVWGTICITVSLGAGRSVATIRFTARSDGTITNLASLCFDSLLYPDGWYDLRITTDLGTVLTSIFRIDNGQRVGLITCGEALAGTQAGQTPYMWICSTAVGSAIGETVRARPPSDYCKWRPSNVAAYLLFPTSPNGSDLRKATSQWISADMALDPWCTAPIMFYPHFGQELIEAGLVALLSAAPGGGFYGVRAYVATGLFTPYLPPMWQALHVEVSAPGYTTHQWNVELPAPVLVPWQWYLYQEPGSSVGIELDVHRLDPNGSTYRIQAWVAGVLTFDMTLTLPAPFPPGLPGLRQASFGGASHWGNIRLTEVPIPCSLQLDVYEDDRETVAWSVSTDPAALYPYLCDPENYGEQEIDVVAGAAMIGTVEVVVVDKNQIRDDQDTGWLTERAHEIYGRRCRLRRFTGETEPGWVTIADGPAGSPRLDNYSAYRWVIKDTRETERMLTAFTEGGTTTIWPRGVLAGFGGILAATTPNAGKYHEIEGYGPSIDLTFSPGYTGGLPPIVEPYLVITDDDLVRMKPDLAVLPEFTRPENYEAPDHAFYVRQDSGSPWQLLNPLLTNALGLRTGTTIRLTIRPAELDDDTAVQFIQAIAVPAGVTVTLTADSMVEVLIVSRGPASEYAPFHLEGLTAGELLQNLYDGEYSLRDTVTGAVVPTGIRYDPAALALMTDPVQLRLTEPITDPRAWAEEFIYAPTGWVPALDYDGRISPVSQVPPVAYSGAKVISNDITEPASTWNAGERVVNRVVFNYPRIYAPATPPEDAIDLLVVREITEEFLEPASIARHAEQRAEFDGSVFAAIGDSTGKATGVELGSTLAAARWLHIGDRYMDGAQSVEVAVMRSETYELRAGSWVLADLSWFPDRITSRRGLLMPAQVMAIADLDCAWRRLLMEEVQFEVPSEYDGGDGGGEEEPAIGDISNLRVERLIAANAHRLLWDHDGTIQTAPAGEYTLVSSGDGLLVVKEWPPQDPRYDGGPAGGGEGIEGQGYADFPIDGTLSDEYDPTAVYELFQYRASLYRNGELLQILIVEYWDYVVGMEPPPEGEMDRPPLDPELVGFYLETPIDGHTLYPPGHPIVVHAYFTEMVTDIEDPRYWWDIRVEWFVNNVVFTSQLVAQRAQLEADPIAVLFNDYNTPVYARVRYENSAGAGSWKLSDTILI